MKFITIIHLLFLTVSFQLTSAQNKKVSIATEPFADASHHWYDINEKSNVISAKPNQPRYKPTQLTEVADNILLYQKNNGGWPKNYDIFAILNPQQKDSLVNAKSILNTTFDNGTTYTHIAALAQVYNATSVAKYKDAAVKGIDFILSAQYKNGGWPQYYPLENNYSTHITFNDDAMIGIMQLLKSIIDHSLQSLSVDSKRLKKINNAYTKGLDCIIKTQINDTGIPIAWCQQYDEITLQPAWARKFEPPSICNGESSGIVLFLMSIDNPSKQIITSVQNAVKWFDQSKIYNTKVKVIPASLIHYQYRTSTTDRVVVNDPQAPPIWTRYYELKTYRPMFCNRDSSIVYSLAEVDRERRDGYGWYTYAPQKVLNQYPAWQRKWASDQNVLLKKK